MKRIAIYIGALPARKDEWNRADWFNYEVVRRILAHGEKQFLLLSEEPVDRFFAGNESTEYLVLGKYTPRVLSMYRRFNYQLPDALKHAGSELLVSLTGVLPLKSRIPSCLLLSDEVAKNKKKFSGEGLSRYRRRYLPRFLRQAGQVMLLSASTKSHLCSGYQVPEHRVCVVRGGVPEPFKALDWEAREEVKAQYAEGREYLLFTGAISKDNQVIHVLKAFSVLKKKMNSSMVLVLAGQQDPAFKKFPKLLNTYHFRKDVTLTGPLPLTEIARLTGGAYARIIPTAPAAFCSPVTETLWCRTPVIAAKNKSNEEAGGDAAVYFDPEDFEGMGEQFCELYKNEELRAQLIARSDEKVKDISWDITADLFWEGLIKSYETATKK